MSIFRDFFAIKQKPVFTGLKFGFGSGGGDAEPLIATGGDQTVDYNGFRIHVFTTTGASTLEVATGGEFYVMAVGGGGGGTSMRGGGSGAGGCVLRDPGHPNGLLTLPAGSIPIIVGDGGTGGQSQFVPGTAAQGNNGEDTIVNSESDVIAGGGGSGAGGWSGNPSVVAQPGPHGSGGGGGESNATAGTGWTPSPSPIYGKGTPGGAGPAPNGGSGGGGWNTSGDPTTRSGGDGRQIPSIFRSPEITGVGTPGPNAEGWWVGGGGGGYPESTPSVGGAGGGGVGNGTGPATTGTIAGKPGTGGGGGGSVAGVTGGKGGSGFVLIAYPLG